MSIIYNIKADIIDIRIDKPKHQDIFFVDTNVWYWQTYSRASVTAKPYQVNEYPKYIKKIRSVNSKLMRCNLILAELAHLIEKTEYEIFCDENGYDTKTFLIKEFRHNFPSERSDVVSEIENVWNTIQKFSDAFSLTIDQLAADTFITDVKNHKIDGYDLYYLAGIRANKLQILTDDGDFSTVPDIGVFTANARVIDAARTCGKLITR
jgi:hypothetical protein